MSTHPSFPLIFDTDKFDVHRAYLDVYADLFNPLKNSGLPVLEIGNWNGGGLALLAEYFQASPVYGFDPIMTPSVSSAIGRIHHHPVDAYNEDALELASSFGPFGLILDDGPHTLESQVWFAGNYPKLLASGGLAVIEDIQDTPHIGLILEGVPDGFVSHVFDLRKINGRYDDIVIAIHKL